MANASRSTESKFIDLSAPRAVFGDLVARALGAARVEPSPMAVAYLIELLDSRVAEPSPAAGPADEPTLAESLLVAHTRNGSERVLRLRRLGDRALFVAGFFGDSLTRRTIDIEYYGDVGRSAYSQVSVSLSQQLAEETWPGLYRELAAHFEDFVEVLAEVGERSRGTRAGDRLRLYERYVRTGSSRDRRRLIRAGELPPDRRVLRTRQ